MASPFSRTHKMARLALLQGSYIGLFTTTPTATDPGVECSGAGYGRVAADLCTPFAYGDGARTENVGLLIFPTPTVDLGVAVAFGLLDAQSGGNLLAFGPLTPARFINADNTIGILPGVVNIVEE